MSIQNTPEKITVLATCFAHTTPSCTPSSAPPFQTMFIFAFKNFHSIPATTMTVYALQMSTLRPLLLPCQEQPSTAYLLQYSKNTASRLICCLSFMVGAPRKATELPLNLSHSGNSHKNSSQVEELCCDYLFSCDQENHCFLMFPHLFCSTTATYIILTLNPKYLTIFFLCACTASYTTNAMKYYFYLVLAE